MYKLTKKIPQDGQIEADQFLHRKEVCYRIAKLKPMGRNEKGWVAIETHLSECTFAQALTPLRLTDAEFRVLVDTAQADLDQRIRDDA